MTRRQRLLALLAVASLATAACAPAASPTPPPAAEATPTPAAEATPTPPAAEEYPRAETIYTTGKQWGPPPTWNPLDPNSAMGVVGLQYETLFLFDPLADSWEPWLAESASWTTPTEYTIKIRPGIKWSDGQPLTAEDVAFTIGLAKLKVVGSNIWDYVTEATATDATTVIVRFGDPAYQQWALWTYNSPILPKHIWEAKANEDILKDINVNGVGSGPYLYRTHAEDRMVWVRNENWWAKSALGLEVGPRYIVDIVNGANHVALGRLMQGEFDLSNNFLPGIATLVDKGYVSTFFKQAPYMLSANTAWLVTNNKKPPLDDKEFRRAIAWAVNVPDIVNKVYGNIVKAADPTGLLPTWDKFIDKAQRDALGFRYDPARAQQILDAAGYTKGDDGFYTGKDGTPIKLTIMVPSGWSDWEAARDVIVASLKAVGINAEARITDYGGLVNDRNNGNFDLVLNNEVQLSNSPWTYYDYIFRQPLMSPEGKNRNFGSYENPDAWALVQQLDRTPVEDAAAQIEITSKLQKIFLEDLPVIPLWYNGLWSQVSNINWTNWPSEDGEQVLPATWNGYWQMGSIKMLTNLQPVPAP
ncbi:MAG TPA: ABC transporter substrate-binding protein [Patescibacteria group bacterium]|nr:ABC transporter substrate-binding protein [Patescibacteria group bacterium]